MTYSQEINAQWPEDPPRYKEMCTLRAVAQSLMERYDASVCTAVAYGAAMPATPEQRQAIEKNAFAILRSLREIKKMYGFVEADWLVAKRDVDRWPLLQWHAVAATAPDVVRLFQEI